MMISIKNGFEFIEMADRLVKARSVVEERLMSWQLAAEEHLKASLLVAIYSAKRATLERFDENFAPQYTIKKGVSFPDLMYVLNGEHFDPIVSFKHLMPFRFAYLTLPFSVKAALSKNAGLNNALKAIAKIDTKPFSDILDDSATESYKVGGQSSFAAMAISVQFKIIDRTILDWLRAYSLNLSDQIAQSVASRIKFQILEGIRNGESVAQIRRRVEKVWGDPIDVSVPAKTDRTGRILRPGYTYQLSNEAWADVVARTEVSRAFAEGRLAAYLQMGVVDLVRFSAAPDERTCSQCSALDGTEFSLNEASGVIPVHGRCRCTWIPIVNNENLQAARAEAVQRIGVLYGGLE